MSSLTECPICLESSGDLVSACAGSKRHKFHMDCLLKIKRICCPSCRGKLKPEIFTIISEKQKQEKALLQGDQESDEEEIIVDLGTLISMDDLEEVDYRLSLGEIPDEDSLIQAICIQHTDLALRLISLGAPCTDYALGYAFAVGLKSVCKAIREKGIDYSEMTLSITIDNDTNMQILTNKVNYLLNRGICPGTRSLNAVLSMFLYNYDLAVKNNEEVQRKKLEGWIAKARVYEKIAQYFVCYCPVPDTEANPRPAISDIDDQIPSTEKLLEDLPSIMKSKIQSLFNPTTKMINRCLEMYFLYPEKSSQNSNMWINNLSHAFSKGSLPDSMTVELSRNDERLSNLLVGSFLV
jgi:hypothetical protein